MLRLAAIALAAVMVSGAIGCVAPEEPAGAGPGGKGDDVDGPGSECSDLAPPGPYTCAEQVGWGKCGEPFMDGYCERSCGVCPDTGDVAECVDVAPGDRYSCAEQAAWGKCEEPWMQGYCEASCGHCAISKRLIDPAATPATRERYGYLVDRYRVSMLSGQQDLADAEYMRELTGRYPAIVGLDFLRDSPAAVEHGARSQAVDDALTWAGRGGLVTISWHWIAPAGLLETAEQPWYKGFYTAATEFDVSRAAYDRDSVERSLVIRDIDAIADRLGQLADAGVPVLWRPLHEGAGRWFWWGAKGGAPYQILWRLMYDRLVNHHGLHNLIWVFNGMDPAYYPGDAYVDIVAEDIYDGERDHSPKEAQYLAATTAYTTAGKLVALSETGSLIDPDRLAASSAHWSWFMLWNTHFSREQAWNLDATKRAVYASEAVVTLDELPAWIH